MKRVLALPLFALFIVACSDVDSTSLGPDGGAANPESLPIAASITTDGTSDRCGTVTDPLDGLPGVQAASPCDGRHNGGAVIPFTEDSYFLPSLVGNPGEVGANLSGLADRIEVRVAPYPNQGACTDAGGKGTQCRIRSTDPAKGGDLDPVAENLDTGFYETAWKTAKKGKGDVVPNDSYWQIIVLVDLNGDGEWGDGEDIISRIIKQTDTPSTDQPADAWSLDIGRGSNQPIKFLFAENDNGCFGRAADPRGEFVQCLVNFNDGGILTLGKTVLEIGAGNNLGTRTITGEECSLKDDGTRNIDVDLELFGVCAQWSVDPPLLDEQGNDIELINSFIWFCQDDVVAAGQAGELGSFAVHMQDALGTQALAPPADAPDCDALLGTVASTGIDAWWGKLAGLFSPKPAVASHGDSGGGRLGTVRSEFQLAKSVAAEVSGSASQQVAAGGTASFTLQVTDHDGQPGDNTTLHAQAVKADGSGLETDTDVFVDCPATLPTTAARCYDRNNSPPVGGPLSQWEAVFVTGGVDADGLAKGQATLELTLGDGSSALSWLGCGVGVPGSDTPADGGFPGDAGPCNRSHLDADEDVSPADGTPDHGYANGYEVGVTDPFNPYIDENPIWINDLPIVTTAEVCSSPVVDGLKGTDEWQDTCVPTGYSDSFIANLGGNLGGDAEATLRWFVGPDDSGFDRLYMSIELPLSSDPSKVKASVEFDAGPGNDFGPDENDDQIEIARDKNSNDPALGDVFDRYLSANCANNASTSVCNTLDTDNLGGTASAEGAVQWADGILFFELSQLLSGDAYDLRVTPAALPASLGFIVQLGVGNVRQGGTVFPEQDGTNSTTIRSEGGRTYRVFTIE